MSHTAKDQTAARPAICLGLGYLDSKGRRVRQKVCQSCGRLFWAIRPHAKTCNDKCRKALSRYGPRITA